MRKFFQGVFIVVCVILILFIAVYVCDVIIQARTCIDITNYPVSIDYGTLSEKQIETFDDIMDAINKGESFVSCPSYPPKERHEITTHIKMHFGYQESIEEAGYLILWGYNGVHLNLDAFNKMLNEKIIIDARVDEAVSTLHEGSDRYKLWQISNYIAKKVEYTYGIRQETITALNGKGRCLSYSMLFYKMATRLGIKTYICSGWITTTTGHAWNMVELNGEYKHYDATWYDGTTHRIEWLHNKSAAITNYLINNEYYASDLDMPTNLNGRIYSYIPEIYMMDFNELGDYAFIDGYIDGEYNYIGYIYKDADGSTYIINNCGCCVRKINFEKTAIIGINE